MDKLKIGIVEDDPIIAEDLGSRLTEMGYDVVFSLPSGEEVIHYFENGVRPDICIMDIQLEGKMDGIETASKIQSLTRVSIIFLTSNSDDYHFAKAKEVKPFAFLSKPFRSKDLNHAIELAVSKSSQSDDSNRTHDEPGYLLSDRVFIKVHDKLIRLFLNDILWVEADDYYCKLFTLEKEYLVGQTMKKFYNLLSNMPQWMRIHRSFIINLFHIEEITDLHVIINKHKIPINKTAKEELMAKLLKI